MDNGSNAMDTLLGLVFILWIPCGIYAMQYCIKEHNWLPWILGGLLCGPVALIAAAGLPDRKLTKYIRILSEDQMKPRKTLAP